MRKAANHRAHLTAYVAGATPAAAGANRYTNLKQYTGQSK